MADALPQIGAMLQSARELTLEAANSVASKLIDDVRLSRTDVERYLNGHTDRERLAGLRQVISLMCQGKNALPFFAGVIKNVASTNPEVCKLVYIYLVRYAAHEQDLALLSINTVQKSLMDKSPLVRALAIRVISNIRVLSIVQIVMLGIKKCSTDPSPIVRRAAATAIAKCYELDASNGTVLLQNLKSLLSDRDPRVVGSAFITLQRSFPDRMDILHSVFRKACSQLPTMDEWGQQAALDCFLKYARIYLRRPEITKSKPTDRSEYAQFVDDEEEEDYDTSAVTVNATDSLDVDSSISENYAVKYDPDLQMLFNSAYPLLFSNNGGVVISASNIYFYLGLPDTFVEYNVAGHVVKLLDAEISVQYLALTNIKIMALCPSRAKAFVPFLKHFFLTPRDLCMIAGLKLDILTLLQNKENENTVINELKYYALTSSDQSIVASAVQAIGRCVDSANVTDSSSILGWLLRQVASCVPNKASRQNSEHSAGYPPVKKPILISECLNVVRNLVLRNPSIHVSTIRQLAKLLDFVSVSEVRASLIWLVGEFVVIAPEIASKVLRRCVKSFKMEETDVRNQIILLASKVYCYWIDNKKKELDSRGLSFEESSEEIEQEIIPKIFSYIMRLARYDDDYDIRDRARMFNALLVGDNGNNTQLGTLLLQAPKICPVTSLREIMSGSSKVSSSSTKPVEKSKNTKTASDSLKQYAENDGINEFIDSDDEPLEETNQESEVEVEEEVITERILGTTPVARLTLGSISLALGHPVDGFTSLPTWAPADQPLLADPSVRDEPVQAQSGIGSTSIISHASDTSRYGQTTPTSISSAQMVFNRTGGFVNKSDNFQTSAAAASQKNKLKQQTLDEFFADVDEESSSEEGSSDEEDGSAEEGSSDEEDESAEETSEDEDGDSSSEEEGEEEEEESSSDDDAHSKLIKK